MLIALILQAFSHGRLRLMIAVYGHARAQAPHSLHLDLSICATWFSSKEMAPKRQTSSQRCAKQPRQALVTSQPPIGHSSQAISITSITFGFDLLPPIASFTRSLRIARSLYTQQRIVGVLPGTIIFGISMTFSAKVSFHACLATSRNTLYFKCCTFVSNLRMFILLQVFIIVSAAVSPRGEAISAVWRLIVLSARAEFPPQSHRGECTQANGICDHTVQFLQHIYGRSVYFEYARFPEKRMVLIGQWRIHL